MIIAAEGRYKAEQDKALDHVLVHRVMAAQLTSFTVR